MAAHRFDRPSLPTGSSRARIACAYALGSQCSLARLKRRVRGHLPPLACRLASAPAVQERLEYRTAGVTDIRAARLVSGCRVGTPVASCTGFHRCLLRPPRDRGDCIREACIESHLMRGRFDVLHFTANDTRSRSPARQPVLVDGQPVARAWCAAARGRSSSQPSRLHARQKRCRRIWHRLQA